MEGKGTENEEEPGDSLRTEEIPRDKDKRKEGHRKEMTDLETEDKDRHGDRHRPEKKRRETSPEPSKIQWRLRPTFLTVKRKEDSRNSLIDWETEERDSVRGTELETEKKVETGNEIKTEKEENKKRPKTEKEEQEEVEIETEAEAGLELEPEIMEKREKLERMETVSEDQLRTPVRERIKHLNKKSQASPGKFPLMKQQLMELYFKKKSPKASKACERIERQPEDENETTKLKGTNISPLLGVSGKPGLPVTTSMGPGPQSEECGRMWGKDGRIRL